MRGNTFSQKTGKRKKKYTMQRQHSQRAEPSHNASLLPIERCPEYHEAIELIGRRWMGAILYALMQGPLRFNEFESMIPGISHRLLTERLRELEEYTIVIRRVIPSSPVKVEYELTEAGLDLKDAVITIMDWGKKWLSPRVTREIDEKHMENARRE